MKMDVPGSNDERQEPVPTPLSSTFLDSHTPGWEGPPPSEYNQPQFPPSLYNIPISETSLHTRPIQPFRTFNYLDAQGEDLGSRQYTLNADNLLEFTSVCVPSEVWSLPPTATTLAPVTPTANEPPSHAHWAPEPAAPAPVASGSDVTLEMLPPTSPNGSRSSPEIPVTPGSESGPIRRCRRSSNNKETPSCKPCNMTFYRKAEYDRHMKTATAHNQGRQFKCEYCGYMFTRADAQVRHKKTCLNNRDGDGSPKGKGKAKDESSD